MARIAADHTIPEVNAQLGQTALQQYSCAGGAFGGLNCGGATQNPNAAPWNGDSAATNNQPTYYVLTAIPTWFVYHLTSAWWFTSARVANVLWLMAFAYLCVIAACRMGAYPSAALGASLFATVNPIMSLQSASVSPDPAACFAALAAIMVWWRLRRHPSVWLRIVISGLVALVALSVKETAVVALIALVAMEATWAHRRLAPVLVHIPDIARRARRRFKAYAPVAGLLVGVVVLHVFLRLVVGPILRGMRPGNSIMADALRAGQPDSISWLLGQPYYELKNAFVSPIGQQAGVWFNVYALALFVVAAAGPLMLALQAPADPHEDWAFVRALRVALTVFLVFFPAFFMVATARISVAFWQPRYILPALTIALVAVTIGMSRRSSLIWASMALFATFIFGVFVTAGLQFP